uniref:Retrotransposon protein, putative, Ty3-gypsy subclass n=2 Tax=Oryza sativa subsp. japonica TaxID=39947 RepID=Q8LMG4_ORYSJ|nr:Hypothetical protein [Oryza sativa Japonica Group]AAP53079.1 retrotransposon protein, putative, Ty3-gypsy subclass [Oryza sativa Japonica Group]
MHPGKGGRDEVGRVLRRPLSLPDSPRHERGLPAALRGVGVKPEVWCAWLEGVMRRVLSRPLSDVDLNVNIVVCVPRPVLDGDFNAHSAWNSTQEFLGVTQPHSTTNQVF